MWKSINWKGTFDTPNDNSENLVTTSSVSIIYRRLLSNANTEAQYELLQEKFIPILDKDISPDEIDLQLRKLKANKAAGYDGLALDVLKYLNDDWIIFVQQNVRWCLP